MFIPTTLSMPEAGYGIITILMIVVFTVAIILVIVVLLFIGSGVIIKIKNPKGNL